MIDHTLKKLLAKRHCTLLAVGPMSKNCVDVTIELSNDLSIPIMMIASRRQVDAAEFGGGYVNNWSTEEFAKYVNDNDRRGKIVLARDHGGPWQNDLEKKEKMSLRQAMDSAKKSFAADIESGFEIIHIDPSVDIFATASTDDTLERLIDLYEYCHTLSQQAGRKILFEIGTEEQSGTVNTLDEIEYTFDEVFGFCRSNDLPVPSFIVVQIGTKVMEMRNVGTFDSPYRVIHELPSEIQVPKMIELCNKYQICIKTHNTDYLSDEALSWHPKLGIHSSNVAPEFGVAETKALLKCLADNGMTGLRDQFLQIAYDSGQWQKWMLPESSASQEEKATIAGHYVFGAKSFAEIKEKAARELMKKNIDLDAYLKERVKGAIMRYLHAFRLLGTQ